MNKDAETTFQGYDQSQPEAPDVKENEVNEVTNFQDEKENKSEKTSKSDKVSGDADGLDIGEDRVEDGDNREPSWEEKYAALNDSFLRLNAEFDNFRKRTIREKADLIKTGGASVLTNLLPVIDDFERAMNTLQTTEDLLSAMKGVNLIYDKFIGYLSQQGVKKIDTIGQPFDTDVFEAVATFPVAEEDRKGKVIDCIQTGYKLYDRVLRHAKVVVGE